MAKKSHSKSTAAQNEQDTAMKQHKKQAKKEAKMMLAIEQEKDSLEKAHDKLASAQARVDAHEAHLRKLEAKLAAYRTSTQIPQPEASDGNFDQQDQPDPHALPDWLNASTNASDENNHAGTDHEESETSPASSSQDTSESPAEEPVTSDSPHETADSPTAEEPASSESPAEAPATSDSSTEAPAASDSSTEEPATSDSSTEAPATSEQQSGEPSPAATVAKRTGMQSLRSRFTRHASTASTKPDTSPAPARRAAARGRSNTNKTMARASNKGE